MKKRWKTGRKLPSLEACGATAVSLPRMCVCVRAAGWDGHPDQLGCNALLGLSVPATLCLSVCLCVCSLLTSPLFPFFLFFSVWLSFFLFPSPVFPFPSITAERKDRSVCVSCFVFIFHFSLFFSFRVFPDQQTIAIYNKYINIQ